MIKSIIMLGIAEEGGHGNTGGGMAKDLITKFSAKAGILYM